MVFSSSAALEPVDYLHGNVGGSPAVAVCVPPTHEEVRNTRLRRMNRERKGRPLHMLSINENVDGKGASQEALPRKVITAVAQVVCFTRNRLRELFILGMRLEKSFQVQVHLDFSTTLYAQVAEHICESKRHAVLKVFGRFPG